MHTLKASAHDSVRHDGWGFEMLGWAVLMWLGMSADAHADVDFMPCDASHGSVMPVNGTTDVALDATVSWVDTWQCWYDTEARFELVVDDEVVAEHSFVIGEEGMMSGVHWSPELQPNTDYQLVLWHGDWSRVRSTFRTGEDTAQPVVTPPELEIWEVTLVRHRTGNQSVSIEGVVTSQDPAGGLMEVELVSDLELSSVLAPSEDGSALYGLSWGVDEENEPEEVCVVVHQQDQARKTVVTSEPMCRAPKIIRPGGCSHVPLGAWAWAGLVSLMMTRRRARHG